MKRNIVTIILGVSIVLTLFGCTSKSEEISQPSAQNNLQEGISQPLIQNNSQEIQENPQVPESVIFLTTDIDVDTADRYTVTHNYDTDAYTDNVELTLYYEGPYGMDTSCHHLWYQYDKTSDLWTLIKEDDAIYEEEINADAYMNSSPWVGRDENIGCDYSVFFYDIDTDQMTVDIGYNIVFDNNSIPRSYNSGIFELSYGYCIDLPYETAYGTEYLTLVFDRNVGLREWGIWGIGTAN